MPKINKRQLIRDEVFRVIGEHLIVDSQFGDYFIYSNKYRFKKINHPMFISGDFEDIYNKLTAMPSGLTEISFWKMLEA